MIPDSHDTPRTPETTVDRPSAEPAHDQRDDKARPKGLVAALAYNLTSMESDSHPDRELIDCCRMWLAIVADIATRRRELLNERDDKAATLDDLYKLEGTLHGYSPTTFEASCLMLEVAAEGLYRRSMDEDSVDYSKLALPFIISVREALSWTAGHIPDYRVGRF